ncbi:acetaldehyde dehydrogenase (acetylating) [Microbulbifer sp. 2304DJ12-6]|uniref:acetaldehyde dehydrogenase (acetylating) n=1 Tax=Microbulbifer sp. 2304DJ12-6 TaxID=3233340 RepID=UPI0039B0A137
MAKIQCMIIGSGNIGTDLMIKIRDTSEKLAVAAVIGVDAESEGLAMAAKSGFATSCKGIEGAQEFTEWDDIRIVFDATSARAHRHHDVICRAAGKQMIDLTPAAIGPYCVPVINMHEHLDKPNVNMVTCGGQATIPIVYAVTRVADSVPYAEIVASVSSQSAGPGTRANIDEFTQTTARGLEKVGGAKYGKAIIVLNPAEPPMIMRDTVYTLSFNAKEKQIEESIHAMLADIQKYVPGYRLKQDVQFETVGIDKPLAIPGYGKAIGLKTTVFLEIEGAGHFLPKYSGNLDIMTSAALATGERIAEFKYGVVA